MQDPKTILSKYWGFISLCIFLFIIACNSPLEKSSDHKLDSSIQPTGDPSMDGVLEDTITCKDLSNKEVVLRFANEAMNRVGLLDIDTADMFLEEGHFIDSKTTQTLIWMQAYGLPSSGNGSNLVMIFTCGKGIELIYSTICGVFTKKNVRDLDGDGILEIVAESEIARMGEYHANYHVFNFADTVQNFLYKAHSFSMLDGSWGDNYEGFFEKGDTLIDSISSEVIYPNGNNIFRIKQVRKISTYNGGKTLEEINNRLKVSQNSSVIPLKK